MSREEVERTLGCWDFQLKVIIDMFIVGAFLLCKKAILSYSFPKVFLLFYHLIPGASSRSLNWQMVALGPACVSVTFQFSFCLPGFGQLDSSLGNQAVGR